MVFLDEVELYCVILVVRSSLHTLVKARQSDESCFLLFIVILSNYSHYKKSDEMRVRRQAFDRFLHFFENIEALRVIQAAYDSQSHVKIWHKAQGTVGLGTMDLVELIVVPLEDGFSVE